jgi:hypothetical protein
MNQANCGNRGCSRIIIIVLYFGKLPGYFPAWLESVKRNRSIDFLLITDTDVCLEIPPNVHYMQWSWEQLIQYMQQKFPFPIHIRTPYKLCDYRMAYGYIFEEYIEDYDFWGYCDVDMVFGDIRAFITEDMLGRFHVIGKYGHLILFKNMDVINRLFMQQGALFPYTEVYSTEEWYSFGEHTGLMQIVLKNNIPHYYNQEAIADIKTAHSCFLIGDHPNYKKQIFYWDEGRVYRAYLEKDTVKLEEFLYLHFQKKNPRLDWGSDEQVSGFYMTSHVFRKRPCKTPTKEELDRFSEYPGGIVLFLEKIKKVIKKMRKFFSINRKQREIWLRQRIYRRSRDYRSE